MESSFFSTTNDFLKHYLFSNFQSETILLKGARIFEFESIAKVLQRKSHQTIMEVNLEALVRNLNYYRSRISPTTKIMAMVKAFSYGAGNVEIAHELLAGHTHIAVKGEILEGFCHRSGGTDSSTCCSTDTCTPTSVLPTAA